VSRGAAWRPLQTTVDGVVTRDVPINEVG
jgi:hypothetical protein